MKIPPSNPLVTRFRRFVMQKLEKPRPVYVRLIFNDMDKLRRAIRPGDVVLVEGRSEMARIINLFSNSHWSHVAMYVGDRLIREDRPDRGIYLERFGADAGNLLVEAYTGQGVTAASLDKYRDYNIRICRPYGITEPDRRAVIDRVVENLGRRYDDRIILDLALMIFQSVFRPMSRRTPDACLGKCNEFQVFCSGMIAKAFQSVGYPIVPALAEKDRGPNPSASPYGARLITRHYSQVLPRDFDLSPNFEIVKFNIVGQGAFRYKDIWVEPGGPAA